MSYAIIILIVSLLLIAIGFIWMFMYFRDRVTSIEQEIYFMHKNVKAINNNIINYFSKIDSIDSKTISIDNKTDTLLKSINSVNNYTKFVAESTARNNRKVKHKKNKEQ